MTRARLRMLILSCAVLVAGCSQKPAMHPDAGPMPTAATSGDSGKASPLAASAATAAPDPLSLLPAEDPKQTLREGFFVYGFSKDAKLAFVETKIEDGKGETTFRLVIHDLRDDVLVEELTHTVPMVIDATTLDAFLQAQGDAARALLAKHAIVGAAERLETTFQHADTTVRVVLSGGDDKIVDGEKARAVVLVKQPGDLEKKIGTVLEKGIAGMPVLFNSRPLAVLRSPFEARAAVFIVTSVRGFEGPPNGRLVTVLGADLERGFVR